MKKTIISVGIFFDGTGNNGQNASGPNKPPKNNESYYGSTTNIYKLFRLFSGDDKIYIEGIGTVTGAEDSDFAMATCNNPSGSLGYSADDKLEKAFDFIKDKMSDTRAEYHFYVYGFSRGAMLARNFCCELQKECPPFSGYTARIKFLGIFDTVESAAFNTYEVAVLPQTEKVLHICALNECRYFFPLTGLLENSKNRKDLKYGAEYAMWKEIFVPGAHADIGGGYLESSQSVYVSPNFTREDEALHYLENICEAAQSEGNRIWDYLLPGCRTEHDEHSSQLFIVRNRVYNELPKIYGRLMIKETNAGGQMFRTDFSDADFTIDAQAHPYIAELSEALELYIEDLAPDLKPDYRYEKLADYTHISANFGLYHPALLQDKKSDNRAEAINNGLNVPGNADDQHHKNQSRTQSEIHHIEEAVVDYAYGTNIPNNDHWTRTIAMKEKFYNRC